VKRALIVCKNEDIECHIAILVSWGGYRERSTDSRCANLEGG
jgi:hypothetical protein